MRGASGSFSVFCSQIAKSDWLDLIVRREAECGMIWFARLAEQSGGSERVRNGGGLWQQALRYNRGIKP